MVARKLAFVLRSIIGLWLGMWTICGIATFVSGLLILSLQFYGYFQLGFWARLTPAGILRGFDITYPLIPWEPIQKLIDCMLLMPLAGVFMWFGFHIAAMAWIARNNIERAAKPPKIVIPTTGERFAELGVSHLEITSKR